MAGAAATKKIHLYFFELAGTGSHMTVGQWKSPKDNAKYKDRLEYYLWLAKLAEKGKITAIFFADVYAGHETEPNTKEAIYRSGSQVALLDPITIISAMAAVTKSVGFAVTGSTTYLPPYLLARMWSSLDHLTNGRMAWNIVTSFTTSAAQAFGRTEGILSHDERYAAADEFMEITYKLWESSWEDGAQIWDADSDTAYDPSKIHEIVHEGKYHRMTGIQQTHPSPQRTPVLFQAGTSKSGIQFAAKHAEVIFALQWTTTELRKIVDETRKAALENGRDPRSLKFMCGMAPILGRTLEEAQAKYNEARKHVSVVGGLAKFAMFSGIDLTKMPLDEPLPVIEGSSAANTIQGFVKQFKACLADTTGPITPRFIGESISLGAMCPMPVGTPEMVADVMEKWLVEADVDGFNLHYVSNPESWEDVVELLVPELQRRGLMWGDYTVVGGTFRENLLNKPGAMFLPPDHPGSQFKWNKANGSNERC